MNLDEFRALKVEQEVKTEDVKETKIEDIKETKPVEEVKPEVKEDKVDDVKPESKPIDKITIEGIGEVTLDELKNGYLRTSDYTKKTQEVAKQRKEVEEALKLYETVKTNPELAKTLSEGVKLPASIDPTTAKVTELETKLYDMMLETEIEKLSVKYPDFEVREVLTYAHDKNIMDLEDAYLLSKSKKVNVKGASTEDLKKQLREEIIKEMEAEKGATRTIITSGVDSKPVVSNEIKISEAESKVAKHMFKDAKDPDAEYVKWRDIGKKK